MMFYTLIALVLIVLVIVLVFLIIFINYLNTLKMKKPSVDLKPQQEVLDKIEKSTKKSKLKIKPKKVTKQKDMLESIVAKAKKTSKSNKKKGYGGGETNGIKRHKKRVIENSKIKHRSKTRK